MEGIKLSLFGVCFCLTGIAFSTNNLLAYGGALIGLIIAGISCFTKNET